MKVELQAVDRTVMVRGEGKSFQKTPKDAVQDFNQDKEFVVYGGKLLRRVGWKADGVTMVYREVSYLTVRAGETFIPEES